MMGEALNFMVVAMSLSMLCGAGFTIGVRTICWLADWAPVNVHVHVHNPPGVTGSVTLGAPALPPDPAR